MNKYSATLAVFSTPQELARAVEAVQFAGSQVIDVCSPIPLSELEELIPRKPSPVRWFTLFGCLSGAAFGIWLQVYSVMAWPIPVGGKPIVSMSAFVVIAFELTILFGALATFGGFLLTSRRPHSGANIYHAGCSRDEFALVVQHESSEFEMIRDLLKKNGAKEVRALEQKKGET